MTTPRGPERPGRPGPSGSPGHAGHAGHAGAAGRGGRGDKGGPAPAWSPLKALAVLVVAVGLGAYLIDLGASRHVAGSATTGTSTTTTTTTPPASSTTTTTTTTAPPGAQPSQSVKVLVANASQTDGVAGYYSQKLAAAGWGTLDPVTATTTVPSSSVYYATGEQAAARSIAEALGLASSVVQALDPDVPVASSTGADVVVVVGDDLAAKVPPSSTGSSASTDSAASSTSTSTAAG